MRRFLICLSVVCFCAAAANAQNSVDSVFKCYKPSVIYSIDIADAPGHAYNLSHRSCTARKGEIAGVAEKSGEASQFDEVNGDSSSFRGQFVEYMANGDRIHYSFEGTATLKRGKFVSGSHTWKTLRGSGRFANIQASGSCNGSANADGTIQWTCTGTYTLTGAETKPAPKQ